jgi:hypothetical protein
VEQCLSLYRVCEDLGAEDQDRRSALPAARPSEWDLAEGQSVPKVIYGFAREDQLDKEAARRPGRSVALSALSH